MFYILNQDNVECAKEETFEQTKQTALKMKEELGENFSIYEYKKIWTTQTLEEALNEEPKLVFVLK